MATETVVAEENEECAAETITDYNMSLRVGALFIILVTSALGKSVPP